MKECSRCQTVRQMAKEGLGGDREYIWKNARVTIIACFDHAMEIFEALNKAQSGESL